MASDLPYTKTTVFSLNGQPYPDETSVVRAAIEQALGNPGISTSVIRECCALAPLLKRACDLGMGRQPPAREE